MQLSDVTQNIRRVRAVIDTADLKMLLAQAVAQQADVNLTDPDVTVRSVELHAGNMPHAEVIIEVKP